MKMPVNYIGIAQGFKKRKHNGVDFGWNSNHGGANQPIYAVEDGKVIYKAVQKSGGNVLHIKHNNGYVSEYGHLATWCVNKNGVVKKGQQIGTMGATGNANGNHLHFGLCKGDKITYTSKDSWVNPLDYLCIYSGQVVGGSTIKNYKLYDTKEVVGVPSEPLNVRNSKNQVVYGLYNGNETEYFGKTLTGKAIVDKANNYTTVNKYLK